MAATYAHLTPDALRWARESAGYSVLEAAQKIGIRWSRLEAAEDGNDLLTLRQAERAADVYERPLAALFMSAPPAEEPPEAQFRRLPGAPELPWPPEMRLLARRVRARQDAAAELYEALEVEPPWPTVVNRFRVANVREDLPAVLRGALGVSEDAQTTWTDGFAALRGWTDAVESLGVLVMQDGSMPLDAMRGFASTDAIVPAVVVNTKDDARARAFSVIHELAHLLVDANGVAPDPYTETLCNEIAGEVMMPRDRLRDVFEDAPGTPLARVDAVARHFTVTPRAAAVRLLRTGLLPTRVGDEVLEAIQARAPAEGSSRGGGDYYWNQINRLGPGFIRLVMTALDSQAVSYPTASTLLGNVKVNNFDALRTYLDRRAAAG